MVIYMNNLDNEKKLLNFKEEIIGEEAKIVIKTYQKRNNVFQDVVLQLGNREIFLGRFPKDEKKLIVKYSDGKILLAYKSQINELEGMKIIKVLSLYEILDDTFYSCTEKEALNIFDSSLDDSFLEEENSLMHRADIEKKKRLR